MTTTRTILFLSILLTACSKDTQGSANAAPASPEAQKFTLAADPGAAKSVTDAKAVGKADQIVVEGRVYNVVKGRGVFSIMDTSLPYCGETNKEDNCKTPWDYCCEPKETRTAKSLLVELRGTDGKPITTPELPGLRQVDKVKVKGTLQQDEHGNHVLIATGLFRTERPQLPDYVKWPQ